MLQNVNLVVTSLNRIRDVIINYMSFCRLGSKPNDERGRGAAVDPVSG